MRSFHLSDKPGRDAFLRLVSVPRPPEPARAARGMSVSQRRFVVSGDRNTHEALSDVHGPDYGQALINGDPEIDLSITGAPVRESLSVFLAMDGSLSVSAPRIVEVVTGPDGSERERRDPIDVAGNIDANEPIRLSKLRFKRADAIRRFVFSRAAAVSHVDGLTLNSSGRLQRNCMQRTNWSWSAQDQRAANHSCCSRTGCLGAGSLKAVSTGIVIA